MASCNQNLTGGKSDCIEVNITPTGQIKGSFKIKPFYPAGYVPSSITLVNPSQLTTNELKGVTTSVPASLDPNVLHCTKDGAAVLAGKTSSVLLFKDSKTNELKADVIIAPAPNPLFPCDTSQPLRNALKLTVDGLAVLTQQIPVGVDVTQCGGAYSYVDCTTGELRVHVQVAPEVLGTECAPLVDDSKRKIKKNGLVCTPAGLAVLTGISEKAIQTFMDCETNELRANLILIPDTGCSTAERRGRNAMYISNEGVGVLTGKNAKGGVTTFVDCDTHELLAEVVIKPAPANSSCETNPNPNALRLFDDGLAVLTGKNTQGGVETFVDCNSQTLFAKVIIKPDAEGANCDPTKLTNGLRLTVEGLAVEFADTSCIRHDIDCNTGFVSSVLVIDPVMANVLKCDNGLNIAFASGCNGLSVKADGLHAFPGPPKNVPLFVGDGESSTITDNKAYTRRTLNASWTMPSDACVNALVEIIYRAPTVVFNYGNGVSATAADVSYSGTFGTGSIGQIYAGIAGSGVNKTQCAGPTEHYYVNMLPGTTLNATFTPAVAVTGGTDLFVTTGSYALNLVVHWGSAI